MTCVVDYHIAKRSVCSTGYHLEGGIMEISRNQYFMAGLVLAVSRNSVPRH